MKENSDWLNVKMTNLVDLEPIVRNRLEPGKSLKYYYETTFPNSKKLNKSKRYQRERAWERHYSKNLFYSFDALHYAAMDAVATCRLGDFDLNK